MEFMYDAPVFLTLFVILFFLIKCVHTYILYYVYKDNFYHNRVW
jgi:hypothetical protein